MGNCLLVQHKFQLILQLLTEATYDTVTVYDGPDDTYPVLGYMVGQYITSNYFYNHRYRSNVCKVHIRCNRCFWRLDSKLYNSNFNSGGGLTMLTTQQEVLVMVQVLIIIQIINSVIGILHHLCNKL